MAIFGFIQLIAISNCLSVYEYYFQEFEKFFNELFSFACKVDSMDKKIFHLMKQILPFRKDCLHPTNPIDNGQIIHVNNV